MSRSTLASLKRLRWAVRATLFLGMAASIAANVLHAEPNIISQAIAAWPPLALLLTVELTSRVPMHRPLLATIRVLSTAVIAGIAAWVSYWHMQDVAVRFGEAEIAAYLLPISVDGLIVVASVSLVELAGRIRTLEQQLAAAPTLAPPAAPAPAPAPEQPPTPAAQPALPVGPTPAPVNGHAPTPPVTQDSPTPGDDAIAGATGDAASPADMSGPAEVNGHQPVDTTSSGGHDSTAPKQRRRPGVGPRNPASRARKAAAARKATRAPAAGASRSDAELLEQLATLPRDESGSISVRRAAAALGTGPDRARRLLTQAGLRQPATTGGGDGQ